MKNSVSRASLLKIAGLVRPAISSMDYIPALTHIKFDGEFATAYNDISAIIVASPIDLKRCVPGDLLIKALGSLSGETVALTYNEADSSLLLQSARSKLKLPTMHPKDFPFDLDPGQDSVEITLSPEMVRGIDQCLLSVGNDPTHASQMGVTLDFGEQGNAMLFSTDNWSISLYETADTIELPGDSPVILPTFFCQQIVSLAKAFPQCGPVLVLLSSGLLVDFVELKTKNVLASVFSKTVVDLQPLDFHKLMAKHFKRPFKGLTNIPDAFDSSFERALLVLGNELEKTARVLVADGLLKIEATSALGDTDDEMAFDPGTKADFKIDPTLVVRGLKQCSKVSFTQKAMVMSDESMKFIHLIAHVAG